MTEQADALPPAKITDRFLAYLLDASPFVLGYYASLALLVARWGVWENTSTSWRRALGAWVGLYLLYQTVGNLSGATPGKRAFGLRVVGPEGGPLGFRRALARALGYIASTPGNLGFLWALFDPRSRALHDLLAGSRVVEGRPRSPGAAVWSAAASLSALAALAVVNLWSAFSQPSPADLEAVRKAADGLRILAAMEEAHRERSGRYTDQLAELARVSGDVAEFKAAMGELFDPYGFRLTAAATAYRLEARARDSRRTRVSLEGPAGANSTSAQRPKDSASRSAPGARETR